nr:MAG: peptidase [Microvirus sp.]
MSINSSSERNLKTLFFTEKEMTLSVTASKEGIDNSLPSSFRPNMLYTMTRMDTIRLMVGCPIFITSGFRCPKLNYTVGGCSDSYHLVGLAVDFTVDFGKSRFSLSDIYGIIDRHKSALGVHELIHYKDRDFIHIAFISPYESI